MPRIPMGEAAGLVRNREDAVEMRGAPGMDFGMDVGRALSDLGRGIGETGRRLGDIGMAFGRHLQDTEDKLNATKIESLWRDRQSALEVRMAKNPGSYDQFEEWARDTDTDFAEASKPFREKMSQRAQELFDAHMDGVRKEALYRRTRIGNQARATVDYNLFQEEWKDAALRGDRERCDAMLEAHRGVLISEQEYGKKKQDFDPLAQAGEAKRRVAAGDRDIADELKETDGEGRYVKYPAMDEAYRMKLLKYAETEEAKRRTAEEEELVYRLQAGEGITEKDIEQAFEGQETKGARERKRNQLEIVKNFREKKAKEQARNAEAKRKKLIDAEEFNILTFSFSSDAAEREKEYAEWKGKILRTYPDDGPTVKRLLGQLNESCKAVAKPDESYKTGFAYRTVSAYLDNDMKPSDFLPKREGKYTFSDKEFRAGQESYQMMKVKLDEYFRQNPDADVDAGMKFLERSREYIRQQTVNDLASAFNNLPGMQAETVRTEKGRKAVFKGKNFVRWAE